MYLRPVLGTALCLMALSSDNPTIRNSSIQDPLVHHDAVIDDSRALFNAGMGVEALEETFRRIGYDLESIRNENQTVPRLVLASVPADLNGIESADRRKAIFIRVMLPAILHANETARDERRAVERIRADKAQGREISSDDRARLEQKAEQYGVDANDLAGLLERIDEVPVSLALAQAAIESGWGTSRFARHGQALFGMRTYGGAGMEPHGVPDANFRVRAFDFPVHSVEAYLQTLNSHAAYAAFRERRAEMRRRGEKLDSHALAATLTRYSERGRDYVNDIRTVMRVNRLRSLDDARFDDTASIEAAVPGSAS